MGGCKSPKQWLLYSWWPTVVKTSQLLSSPGMTEMVRKITLSRAVRIMQNLFPEEYSFYPRSWILPDEFQLFAAQVDALRPHDA